MKILLVGDIHANRFYLRRAMEYGQENGAERVFFLGDFGWDFDDRFMNTANEVSKETGLTVEFIDGNHEDFDFLDSIKVDDDGRRFLSENVIHHTRGRVENLDGHNVLFMGGATSVDKLWRGPGEWWPQENISINDYQTALNNCDGIEIATVFAHDAPIMPFHGNKGISSWFPHDALVDSMNNREIMRRLALETEPKNWYHGHYHRSDYNVIEFPYGDLNVYCLDRDGSKVADNLKLVETDDWYAD